MATDNRKLFIADLGTDEIVSSGLSGGGFTTLYDTGTGNPFGIAVDTSNDKVYFTDQVNSFVKRCNRDGSNVEILASGDDGLTRPMGIAIDRINQKLYVADLTNDEIYKLDAGGGNFEIIASGADGLDGPIGIAVDEIAGKIYWTDNVDNNIRWSDLNGDNIAVIVTGLNSPGSIEVDHNGGKIYWTEDGSNSVNRADLDGQNDEEIISVGTTAPWGITIDTINNKVYWTDSAVDLIRRCDLNGDNIETVVSSGAPSDFRDIDIDQIPTITDQILLYIIGPNQLNDNINLFITGLDQITDSIDLFINGVFSADIPLFVKLADFITDEINLFTAGPLQTTNNIDLFETGHVPINSGIDLYTDAHGAVSGNISLHTIAIDSSSSGIDLIIQGPLSRSDDIAFYIVASGSIADWPLFISMIGNDTSDTNQLFIYGSPSGQDLSYRKNFTSLMIWCQGDDVIYPPIMDGTYPLFIEVPSGNESGVNSWPLFIHSDTRSLKDIDFWIRGKSGLADPIEDSIRLYLNNLVVPGTFDSQSNEWSLFMQCIEGNSNYINCYVSGSPIPVTGINGSIDEFIGGHEYLNDNINLYNFGVSGIINDSISLVMPVISGVFFDIIEMYTHGY